MQSFIQDFGILFIVVVVITYITKLLKQPAIIGYVVSGFIFSLILSADSPSGGQIVILSELGITFLLFLMGLEFNLNNLKYLGKDLVIATLLQSAAFLVIGIPLNYLFGFSLIENVYLSILLMFSSTLLVAKLIEDKKDSSSLYGKVVLGILIIQDLFAIIALTLLSMLTEAEFNKILLIPLGGIALIIISFIFTKYVLNFLISRIVKLPELMFIFSLGVCFLFVEISPLFGYSMTIGAFIAGVSLANTEYKNDISSKLKPLIIFFNMLFFVGLGYQLKTSLSLKTAIYIASIIIISLVIKPVIVYVTLKLRGYDIRTSFRTGLNLAQLSEFGIIIVSAGILSSLISDEIGTITTISVIITMVLSSYLIKYDKIIYNLLEKFIQRVDIKFPTKYTDESGTAQVYDYNILFFGYYDLSKELYSKLEGTGAKILVIENDPTNIGLLKKESIKYIYNSVANPYFFNNLSFEKVNLVVSNLIDTNDNIMVIKKLKKENPSSHIIVTAKSLKDSLELYDNGADYVIYPSFINEQHVSVLLEDYTTDINKILAKKVIDITKLKERSQKRESVSTNLNATFDINTYLSRIKNIKNIGIRKSIDNKFDIKGYINKIKARRAQKKESAEKTQPKA